MPYANKHKMLKGKIVNYQKGVPKPQRTVEQAIEVSKKICGLYATGKYTLEQCCKKYFVSPGAFRAWACSTIDVGKMIAEKKPLPKRFILAVHNMYKECIRINQESYMDLVKGKARAGLLKKVEGYEVQEIQEDYELDKRMYIEDEDGEKIKNPDFGKMVMIKQKIKKYEQAPDTTAITFALTNADKENFKERKFVSQDTTVHMDEGLEGLKSLEDVKKKRKQMEFELEKKRKEFEAEEVEYEEVKD